MSERVALVTGAGRCESIGFAVVSELLRSSEYRVFASSHPEYDGVLDGDGVAPQDLQESARERFAYVEADLEDHEAPAALVAATLRCYGRIDAVVACHARASSQTLAQMTAADLDRAWAVNARASALLVQAFAASFSASDGGRVVLFTSGQHLGPMASEIPYAISKGAIHQMTMSLADAVSEKGITVNTINPGPNDTGWASDELSDALKESFPAGRWGTPEDISPLVRWLLSHESSWVTGQVINAEGGFRRQPRIEPDS